MATMPVLGQAEVRSRQELHLGLLPVWQGSWLLGHLLLLLLGLQQEDGLKVEQLRHQQESI